MSSYIKKEKRAELVDWLAGECFSYKFSYYTLHLAITIMDKYLFAKYKKRTNFEEIAAVCLVLASKMEEIKFIDLGLMSENIKTSYDELLQLEEEILKCLHFNLCQDTIVTHFFVDDFITSNDYYFACYIASVVLLDFDSVHLNPTLSALKIKKFCENIKYNLVSIDDWYIEEPMYSFCHYYWEQSNISNNNIKKFFDIEKYNVSNIQCTQINIKNNEIINYNNNDKIKKIKLNNNNPLNNKIILYSNEAMKKATVCKYLGKGAFATVRHIKIGNRDIAYKKFSFDNNGRKIGIDFHILREINAFMKLNHPNIIQMDGCYFNSSKKKIGIGLELMDRTLYDTIQFSPNSKTIKEMYILQLLNGLKYMHDNQIMHRDLSVWNILVKENKLKISDMGASRFFRDEKHPIPFSNGVCVLYFRPIEILLGKTPYCSKIDIWSCACVIAFILQKNFLFSASNEKTMVDDIFEMLGTPTEGEICQWPGFNSAFTKWTRKGIINLDNNYPEEVDIIYKMLEYLPEKRIDINESLKLFSNLYIANSN